MLAQSFLVCVTRERERDGSCIAFLSLAWKATSFVTCHLHYILFEQARGGQTVALGPNLSDYLFIKLVLLEQNNAHSFMYCQWLLLHHNDNAA